MKTGKRKFIINVFFILLLLLVVVSVALFSFDSTMRAREYANQMNSLRELSVQGSYIVEEKLQGYLNVLRGIAEFLPKGELHTEENMEKLKVVALEKELDFVRIGLADETGKSRITNGMELDVSDGNYFVGSMNGHSVITEHRESSLTQSGIFIASVPVPDEYGKPRGVIYGVVEVDSFQIYDNTSLDHESQYIQVIDRNGRYIFREEAQNSIVTDENIFEGMYMVETSIPPEEIIQKIRNGEEVIVNADNGEDSFVSCFLPLEMNDWYVVTVMGEDDIFKDVRELLGKDLYLLIAEVAGTVLILCGLILFFLRRESQYVKTLYERLKMNDEMIQAAVSNSHTIILIYDMAEDELRFLANDNMKIELPAVIAHASAKLAEYLPDSSDTRNQLREIFHSLPYIEDTREFTISIPVSGEFHFYRLQIKKVYGSQSVQAQCVGVMEDITEEMELKKEITVREQLLSAATGFMVIDLTEDRVLRGAKALMNFCGSDRTYSELLRTEGIKMVAPEYKDIILERVTTDKLLESFERGETHVEIEYPVFSEQGTFWMESSVRMDRDEETGHVIAYDLLRNINEKKKKELILAEQAGRDYLTGLHNRRSGTELIDSFLKTGKRSAGNVHAFIILDLDNFKNLNDTLGHQMGDQALQDVADILHRHFREYDILCRLAGDEFVVFLKDIPREVIERNMGSLIKKLKLTYGSGEDQVTITVSAGIALSPENGTDFAELYQKADRSLYQVKENGKQFYGIYVKTRESES